MLPAPDQDGTAGRLHLAFLASPLAVRDSLARMLAAQPLRSLSPDARGTAEIVLAEVLNNLVEHAYPDGPGPVSVTLIPVAEGIHCLVVDHGLAMPGGKLPEGKLPAVETRLERQPEGGFGWHLIRRLTRDLTYVRTGGSNRLSFLLAQDG